MKDKKTTSDGLACSNEGDDIVYLTALEENGIVKAEIDGSLSVLTSDPKQMVWPDTIGKCQENFQKIITICLRIRSPWLYSFC